MYRSVNFIRSSLVPVAMPVAGIAAIVVLLLTWSRRKATNFCIGFWADVVSVIIGMKVQISGQENLRHPRPAVFVLNHQSNADGFLVAKLIRRDIAFLGKAEISKQPIRSRFMQFGGLILVDRSDPAAASNSMRALIEAIRKDGRSAAIFPEGRRSHSTTLGQFKKGAFLIALRARVPIVPIVIHNSIDAQPKGEKQFRPATIRVDVLPAIDTSSWKVRTLDQHMADVRDLFLEALGQ